jgi:hypothetical protein
MVGSFHKSAWSSGKNADQFKNLKHPARDTTDAALRRKNQDKLAGLRHNQAPRHAAACAQAQAGWAEKQKSNMMKV